MADSFLGSTGFEAILSREIALPFVESEAVIRAEFPSAPRRVQLMLAGAAFMGSFRVNEDAAVGLKMLQDRYSGEEPVPCHRLHYDEFADMEDDEAEEDFWDTVDNLLGWQVAGVHEPYFLRELYDLTDNTNDSMADRYLRPLAADPTRVPDVHPAPAYSRSELESIAEAAKQRHESFWKYAELEEGVFDRTVAEVLEVSAEGLDISIAGTRGVGKTHFLVPKLVQAFEDQGKKVTYRFGDIMEHSLDAAIAEGTDVLVLDEPTPRDNERIKEALQQAPDLRIVTTLGVYASEEERKLLAGSLSEVQRELGREIYAKELDELPVLSEASIRRWGVENGAEPELVDFIIANPLLRLCRPFDMIFNGGIRNPRANSAELDALGIVGDQFMDRIRIEALNYYPATGKQRPPLLISTKKELLVALDTRLGYLSASRNAPVFFLEYVLSNTTDYTGKALALYQQYCTANDRVAQSCIDLARSKEYC